jgi:hypothetical protein
LQAAAATQASDEKKSPPQAHHTISAHAPDDQPWIAAGMIIDVSNRRRLNLDCLACTAPSSVVRINDANEPACAVRVRKRIGMNRLPRCNFELGNAVRISQPDNPIPFFSGM